MQIPESLQKFIDEGAPGALTYSEYRALVRQLLAEGKCTGAEQRADYLEFTKLNEVRMDRWEKHLKLAPEAEQKVKELPAQKWLVITEGWCGDGAQTLPVFFKLSELNSAIELLVILRDDNAEIMNSFLTGTSRSIPIVVAFSGTDMLWKWGPRPTEATALIPEWKRETPEGKSWKEKLHLWYARDQAHALQRDILERIQ
jgi:hypothetical protein